MGVTVDSAGDLPLVPAVQRRSVLWTWLMTVGMSVGAVLLAVPAWMSDPAAAAPDPQWFMLVPLFALAEVVVIHLPTQRNAHGHTLREIPAVLGLTFLAPQQYVTAYVVGAVLALVLSARMRGVKLAFNAAMFGLEAALGALAYHAILGGGDPLSLQGWFAVLTAVLVTDLLSAAAVTAAISITEGAFDGEVLSEAIRSGSVAAFINTCVALLVATLVIVQPSALPLLGVVVVLLVLAHRVYIALARGHAQTQALYRFVDQTSSAHSVEDANRIVLREAAELTQAERAYLVEIGDGRHLRHHLADGDLIHTEHATDDESDAWWHAAEGGGVSRYHRPRGPRGDEPAPAAGDLAAPRDGLAVRLKMTSAPTYVLVVCDHAFDKETFSDDDARVLEALAAHATVALERARGISELETLATELAVARDAALAASEAKSLFLANMSHEIRTPLTTVLATAELLEDTATDAAQLGLLERMTRQGTLLHSLVEQILDFSRIEAGEVTLASAVFDLHSMAADVAEVYEERAALAGLRFSCDVDPQVPRLVVGDSARVFQVLTNLLDNAVKFTHDGTISLSVAPAAYGEVTGPSPAVSLGVSDSGIGVSEEHLASIFETFSQVDASATRHYEGTGLGLAIVRQLSELMGGRVTVESRLGVGSTFTVTVPFGQPESPTAASAAPATSTTSATSATSAAEDDHGLARL